MKIYKAKDYKDMSRKAANIISAQVIMKPNCVLGLATGSTPIGTYDQLVEWYNKGDLVLNHLGNLVEVVEVGILRCVDLGVVVGVGVEADGVAIVIGLLDHVVVVGVVSHHEERRLGAVLVEDVEHALGVLGGAVIKGEVDDLLSVVLEAPVRLGVWVKGKLRRTGVGCGGRCG